MASAVTVIALVASVLVGAALQRIAGMGFAMVVAPFAILLLPGQQGVVFANLCGAATALALIWPVLREIDWGRLGVLSVTSVFGAAAGAVIIRSLDAGMFRVVVGVVLLAGIALSLAMSKATYMAPPICASLAAGTATGMLVTMSGIGGPPMSIYALATRWEHHRFAATMQPFVALSSVIGASAVLLSMPEAVPVLDPTVWVLIIIGIAAGLVGGNALHRVVPPRIGRLTVVLLGVAGAVTAIISGAAALSAPA